MRRFVLIPLMLGACHAAADSDRGAAPDPCGAGAMQHMVGKHEMDLPPTFDMHLMQIVRPGMDADGSVPERLRIHVDENGIITKVDCG